jgi:hypothetical protein
MISRRSALSLGLLTLARAWVRAGSDAAPPLQLPPHPRLLLTDAEVPAVRSRLARSEVFAARYQALLRAADAQVRKAVDLPPRGGQWFHWYVCKKDGGDLQTVSPTEHRCPVCGTVYHGWPYDDVVLMRAHDAYSGAVRNLGLAHRLSGEQKYADRARDILLAYARQYRRYPLHDKDGKERVGGGHVGPQTLDEAVWLIGICQGADLVWDRLGADDRQEVETGLLRPAAETIRRHRMGIHNIQCWKNSAVGLVGLLLGDAELVADAVTSEHGFREQIARGINDDGQWYEGAWGYHFYALSALVPLAEAGERCGLGLYAYRHEGKILRRLFEAPLELAMPNLELPAFNDSAQVSVRGNHGLYELALARYGDPRFAGVLRGGERDSLEALLVGVADLPDPPARASASRNYPSAGYAVLQAGEGPEATWLCLKYGPHGGGHGHPDKLHFILYSRGQVLGYDPGTGKYGAPLHDGWQKTTLAHNTLTADEANQKPATGRCLAFRSEPGWSAALADAGPIYDGVTYRRAVALVRSDLVLVLDLVRSAREHTFDLAFHEAGAWSADPQGEAVRVPDRPGYRYLEGMVRVTGPLPPIESGRLRLGLAVAAAEGGEVWAGTGAGRTSSERVPCAVLRVRGRTATAAWALHLGRSVPAVRLAPAGPGWAAEANVDGRTWRLTVDPEGREKIVVE